MKRTIIAAASVALLASASFAVAQSNKAGGPQPPNAEQMAANADAMADARIAALQAGLRLTPDQQKLWPALETALRDYSKEQSDWRAQRFEQRQAMREQHQAMRGPGGPDGQRGPGKGPGKGPGNGPGPGAGPDGAQGPGRDVVAMMEMRGEHMVERGTALKKLADAAQPLYGTLDPAQKHRFNLLFREAQEGGFGGRMAGRGHDGWQGKRMHMMGGRGPGQGWCGPNMERGMGPGMNPSADPAADPSDTDGDTL
ncbi:Spy/CpxP family protein refolding chaperone [Ancylobacter pratisalsi]|uniref:Spy/CpxP family protein refolding chaperone n=1 Tax=Ancylobacter pratisalsi TaxID=1745854 RepID=A0A6P1YJ60_9HYPH|nr:Spy/CpxP family protein refolding chaperone [Ancylobacter pratisalsi]QIB33417.1 hypothetical protein G3A50_06620 [Ancylobacter pratisalsi]